jgi:hypothetical protein
VIARVCAYRGLKRELIRGYLEGKSVPAVIPRPPVHLNLERECLGTEDRSHYSQD